MGPMGRMGPMVMGQWDEGTFLWGTMGLWDGVTRHLLAGCLRCSELGETRHNRKRAACATF